MRGGCLVVLALVAAGSVAKAQAPRSELGPPSDAAEPTAPPEHTPAPNDAVDPPPQDPPDGSVAGVEADVEADVASAATGPRATAAGPPPDGSPWVLDDGATFEEVAWDPLPTGSPLVPRGRVHFGLTLRVAALPGDSSPAPDGPQVELGFVFDFQLRERSPFHMRAVLSVSGRPHGDRYLGGGVTDSTGPLAVKLRLMPLSVHLLEWLAVRVGAALSVDWVPGPLGDIAGVGGGVDAEIVARFFEGQLEVGITGGLQLDAVGRTTRLGVEQTVAPEPMIGLVGSWIWP